MKILIKVGAETACYFYNVNDNGNLNLFTKLTN